MNLVFFLKILGCSRNDNLDLVFVLDSSASLSSGDFDSTKYFVSSVLDQFNVGKVRVAVVVYSTTVNAAFYLNTYNTKAEVQKAVDGIRRNAGSTRTDLALNFAVDNVFTIAHGSRPGAAKVTFYFVNRGPVIQSFASCFLSSINVEYLINMSIVENTKNKVGMTFIEIDGWYSVVSC